MVEWVAGVLNCKIPTTYLQKATVILGDLFLFFRISGLILLIKRGSWLEGS
jgi:hypothetical protein